jgi:exodeoxyribonuclease VII small subunit
MTVPADDIAALSFEAALARLEKIVHTLEAGDASLEDSIALYTQGQALKAHCEDKLAGATARIEAIQVGADGAPTTTAFDA